MSTDAMYMTSPHVMGPSGKHTGGMTHVPKLDKQRTKRNDKASSQKSNNNQIAITIPSTQVLPNGEKPDFGNSTTSRRSKNSTQRKGGANKEQKDVSKGLRSLRLADGKTKNAKENRNNKSQNAKPESGPESSSESGPGLHSNMTQISSTSSPTLLASSLEKPTAAATGFPVAPVVSPPLTGLSHVMPHSIPHPPLPPPTDVQHLRMQPPPFGGAGYPYGNYAVAPMPAMAFPVANQMYPQMPMPTMQMQIPQVNSGMKPQPTMMETTGAVKPSTTSVSSKNSDSKQTTNTKATTFAGASFASKDPVINKLPKPSFA